MVGGSHLISKKDKALIYHQRIVYLGSNHPVANYANSLGGWTNSLARLIAESISNPAKELSKVFWRKNATVQTSKNYLRKYKYFVVWWASSSD